MDKEQIEIIKIVDKAISHASILEKGWKAIAKVDIRYHDLTLKCTLIRGIDRITKRPFYFIEMPCMKYRINKSHKWKNINLLNFESKNESDQFQNIAFGLILHSRHDLFLEDINLEREKDIYQDKEPNKE